MSAEDQLAVHEQHLQAELAARGLERGNPVGVRRMIEAPADWIWQVMAQPGHLIRCHPFCAKYEVDQGPGVGYGLELWP